LALVGAIVLILLGLIAIFADWLVPYGFAQTVRDPVTHAIIKNQFPSAAHWFGTDAASRDEFSRVLYGTRISLSVGLVRQLIILLVGVPMGLLAGYYGRWVDMVLMRITDIMYAFPTILFAIVILATIGQNLVNIYLAIGFTFWPPMARLVRSQV